MKAAAPFRVTTRDETILQYIARFRLLNLPLLMRIVSGSVRGVRNRLALLTAHKYLVRLKATLTEPLAYGLANNGARFLAKRGYNINPRTDWTAKNHRSDHFRAHTIAIADTMLHFDHAAAAHEIILVDHHELLPHLPEQTQRTERPFSARVPLRHQNKPLSVHLEPDRLFTLSYPDPLHNFALEQDLGTMDIWSNRIVGKSSIRRKQLAYFHGRVQRRFLIRWGFKSFRVLIITTSDARINTMLRAQRRVAPDCPPGFFMYSTPKRIARHGALGPAWVTIKRDNVSLLHSS